MSFFEPLGTGQGDARVGAADPNTPNFFPGLGPSGPSDLAQASFDWDAPRGEALLAKFATLDDAGISVLTSDDFRQALVTALFHAEMNAVAAGLTIAIPTDKGPGVIIGSAFQKANQNPSLPGAREYLLAFANVNAAIAATQPAKSGAVPTLGVAQPVIAPLVVVLLVLAGAAIIAGTAYVASVYVQTHNDAIARVARCQMAADLAIKGLPVPAGMCPPEPAPPSAPSTIADSLKLFGIAGVLFGGAYLILSVRGK